LFRDRGAQQAQLTHFAKDGGVSAAITKGLGHPGEQLVLAVRSGGIAHHALVIRELAIQQKRVLPIEGGVAHGVLRLKKGMAGS
jgi:hypothetical protein